MPHFTVTLTQGAPVIDMLVMVSQARRDALQSAGAGVPPPQQIRALVDTGASHTCIDPTVLLALQLQPTGSIAMHTPSTAGIPFAADTYDVGVLLGNSQTAVPFLKTNMQVSATNLLASGCHALVGRDILAHFVVTYNGAMQLITLAY